MQQPQLPRLLIATPTRTEPPVNTTEIEVLGFVLSQGINRAGKVQVLVETASGELEVVYPVDAPPGFRYRMEPPLAVIKHQFETAQRTELAKHGLVGGARGPLQVMDPSKKG